MSPSNLTRRKIALPCRIRPSPQATRWTDTHFYSLKKTERKWLVVEGRGFGSSSYLPLLPELGEFPRDAAPVLRHGGSRRRRRPDGDRGPGGRRSPERDPPRGRRGAPPGPHGGERRRPGGRGGGGLQRERHGGGGEDGGRALALALAGRLLASRARARGGIGARDL